MGWLETIGRSRNRVVQAAVALTAPATFLRLLLARGGRRAGVSPGRPYAVTLSFDIDRRADVEALPELLAMLRAHGLRASFAMIGSYALEFPDAHRAVIEAGHEAVNHTLNHPNHYELAPNRKFPDLSDEDMRREVEEGDRAIREVCGVAPVGFRAPHFGDLHTKRVYPILVDLGYRVSSSRMAVCDVFGGCPSHTGVGDLVEFPVANCPRHPHSVLDSWHALERSRPWHAKPGAFTGQVRELLAITSRTGTYLNVYVDPAALVHLPDHDAFLALFTGEGATSTPYGELVASGRYLPVGHPSES